ncbi:Cellulose synthase [Corchorus olitorius]|uniref:Cellulose synthase n=1 Tax=Corchorus olitorius TaxID=93759 RepID=A0A1R3GAZ9_9ROSI|nr:Cellulose synthase [Corchorus olitorius]
MKTRIETTTKLNRIPEEIRKQHKGFREWDFVSSKRDHQTILQILIDGRDSNAVDIEGKPLPTLVYLAREKRPQFHHNFKAGAMNALIRVSSRISNGPIILNVDCDMYSNNSESIKDALCFFMDEEKGNEIAYVQYPQNFENITKNEIYGCSFRVIQKLEFYGLDANGGPLYIGSGCFHRREALSAGKKYDQNYKVDWKKLNEKKIEESASVLEETSSVLASCTFEQNTLWGKEMGLKYGFPVEDIVTGLSAKCKGWKAIYLNPQREAFLGVAPITLLQLLIPLKLRLAYCTYNLWAANCLATLYYVVVPCLCLLKGISLFPQTSSPWVLSFAYVVFAHRAYSLGEFLCFGGTLLESGFVITTKVADDDVSERYEQELIEFGATSPMFDILATLAMVNLFSSVMAIRKVILDVESMVLDQFGLQILLSFLLVAINLPVYQALFFRKDNGRMPSSVTYKSIFLALLASTLAVY